MVTRIQGDDWIVLDADDVSYGVQTPAVFRWTDSFCSRMVRGNGPRIAPCSALIPAYADAPIAQQLPIGSYIGVPLLNADKTLFGTLCAIDPLPQPESICNHLPLVELVATMLGALLSAEIQAEQMGRQAERAKAEAESDFLTGLHNRRGWERFVVAEEARCRRYGHSACVIALDIDGLKMVNDSEGHAAGDALILRASQALKSAVRSSDLVARVGGDEFLVLGVECEAADAQTLRERIESTLREHEVTASLGMSKRLPTRTLEEAVKEADRMMFREKERRKLSRNGPYRDLPRSQTFSY